MARERVLQVEFTQPVRQTLAMTGALIGVGVIAWLLYAPIETVFRANVFLNGLIVAVFVLGVLTCFRAVYQISACVDWIEGFAADRAGHEFTKPPRLMRSLQALLRDRGSRAALSATSTRSILDSVAIRLDEARDISRYLGNLLIFLGLLGTFWGLSNTVPAVVDTIRSLAPADDGAGGGAAVFDNLMAGLEDQLGGMGTAFASSLLGLAGSLVVGLLELFAGQAQGRFFRQLEEWLASMTRIAAAGGDGDGEGAGMTALIEQNALQIEALEKVLERDETKREALEARLASLTDTISRLAGAMGGGQDATLAALERIAQGVEARPAAAPGDTTEGDGLEDMEIRARLRSIDRQMMRLVDEIAASRQDAVADLRADLHGLQRVMTALVDSAGAAGALDRRR